MPKIDPKNNTITPEVGSGQPHVDKAPKPVNFKSKIQKLLGHKKSQRQGSYGANGGHPNRG